MSNDNNNDGKKPSTLVVPNKNIVDLQGRRMQSQQPQETEEEAGPSLPPVRTFRFVLTDGTSFERSGFLNATGAFVVIGVGEGEMGGIIPMANLRAAYLVEDLVPEKDNGFVAAGSA